MVPRGVEYFSVDFHVFFCLADLPTMALETQWSRKGFARNSPSRTVRSLDPGPEIQRKQVWGKADGGRKGDKS